MRSCDREAVRYLLDAGASVELRNSSGETPLITLASTLISPLPHGADLLSRRLVFQLLLDAGSDVNAANMKGRTALHIIASTKSDKDVETRIACAKLLIHRGANVEALDEDGQTPAALYALPNTEFLQLLDPRIRTSTS